MAGVPFVRAGSMMRDAGRPQAAGPGVDTFDGDLEWILEKLTQRARASCGLLFSYVEDEEPRVIAQFHADAQLPAPALARLAALLRASAVAGAGVDDELRHCEFDLRREGGGQVRALYLRFSPAPGVRVLAVVCRREASINLVHEIVARRVQPVLARYLRLWWWHRTERRRADLLERALEFTDLGVVLLDAAGRVIHANAWAKTLLEGGDGLRLLQGRVEATSGDDGARLQAALRGAMSGTPQVPLVSVRRAAKRALLVCVIGEARRALDPRDAAALLYVIDPDHDLRSLLSPACRLYGLTGSEARLVSQLVSGADLNAAAQQMNVGVNTARSYLKQVFAKTGTNRQADLVRVMIGSAARAPAMMSVI